ncbi:aldo/keto reductase family protein KNAG_0A07750 [Huiozyma naganishii CBS 8797]|uniref:NADP-dependent oxidoreductase domain-containing protein n=1 Tax=Huiozyma naganishii (strain ATCC MYA-139 / BCRC 22969 / CBS 8797 / KCTC 17520 / NBRC 10181 / NCYC 3082 / Yp74L-3) TaxID=1071383 RepID=J7RUC4_HUIN7|nr:hypothetical protein KNAG_0A07750 [Kazachstania naganishii CBS 8797]CCK68427.1 hypothetical protein KNAG_0A07750 [Kazachstania naganishii CBS 8797]
MSKVEQIRKDLNEIHTGYGMMSLTWAAKVVPVQQSHEAMKKVVDLAIENNTKAFFNVGEFYGPDLVNLKLVKSFFEKYPELRSKVIISCKGAYNIETFQATGKYDEVIASIKRCCDAVGGYIDIFEPARLDLSILKEGEVYPRESFEAQAKMIEESFIGAISLSEVTGEQIRAVAKDWGKYLVCVELELSMFSRDILINGTAKACSDLNLTIICYSPLGRGLLTGTVKAKAPPKGEFKAMLKRFQGDALEHNLLLVQFLQEEIVDKRPKDQQITLPQLALGWVKKWQRSKTFPGANFIPIPSGSSASRVAENFDEVKGKITEDEFAKINEFLEHFEVIGDREEMNV